MTDTDNSNQPLVWFVMNAYKCEEKIEKELLAAGIDCFLPRSYTIRNVRGKKSKKLDVVIPNIIFVNARYDKINEFQRLRQRFFFATMPRTDGSNSIMTVSDTEMENFMKIARHYDDDITFFSVDEINIKRGTRVQVIGGVFDGAEGKFVKVKGKRNRCVVVQIDNIMCVAVDLHPDLIRIIE